MAYLGNTPDVNTYTLGVQKFSGTGACTQFGLARNTSDANTLGVVVNGIVQTPGDSYTVANGVITFTEPPALSSNNIIITYLATSVFTQIIPGQLLPASVTQTSLASSSVTSEKILDGTIQTVDIATSAITGNLIANNAVSGNNIVSPPDIFDDAFLFGGM